MRADVAIVVTTYWPTGRTGEQRMYAAMQAVDSWWDEMSSEASSLALVIVDDGSDPEWRNSAQEGWWEGHPIIETPRLGCAGALRAGARFVVDNDMADVIFYAQDDWELTEPLDLAPSLALIRDGYADVVRLGPTHPSLAGVVFRTEIPDAEWCLAYRWAEGGYVVGWRPALYRASVLAESLDGIPDGLSAIEGERIWLERMAGARVFHAPNCTLAGPFRHIETVELGEDAPETLTERYRNA